jgi:hypothetical protein
MEKDKGCRVANVAMARVRILRGPYLGRYDGNVMHMSLTQTHEGEARGDFEILEVFEPGMPDP